MCKINFITVDLTHEASETVGTEDRPAEAAQHLETAAKLMVRTKQYDRAAEALHTTLQLYSEGKGAAAAGRVVLNLILVQVGTGAPLQNPDRIPISHILK